MIISINGEEFNFEDKISVNDLILKLELDVEKIAVERNKIVVPFSEFKQTSLEENDQIEIIHFIGGG